MSRLEVPDLPDRVVADTPIALRLPLVTRDRRGELRPNGPLEASLFREITHAAWTIKRCHRAEADLGYASGADPMLDVQNEAKLRRVDAYLRRAERSFHRSMKELRAVQTERIFRAVAHFEDAEMAMQRSLVSYYSLEPKANRKPEPQQRSLQPEPWSIQRGAILDRLGT